MSLSPDKITLESARRYPVLESVEQATCEGNESVAEWRAEVSVGESIAGGSTEQVTSSPVCVGTSEMTGKHDCTSAEP